MTTNRLTREEAKVLEKARQLFRHRTSQNHNHLMAAIGEWIRAEKALPSATFRSREGKAA